MPSSGSDWSSFFLSLSFSPYLCIIPPRGWGGKQYIGRYEEGKTDGGRLPVSTNLTLLKRWPGDSNLILIGSRLRKSVWMIAAPDCSQSQFHIFMLELPLVLFDYCSMQTQNQVVVWSSFPFASWLYSRNGLNGTCQGNSNICTGCCTSIYEKWNKYRMTHKIALFSIRIQVGIVRPHLWSMGSESLWKRSKQDPGNRDRGRLWKIVVCSPHT